MSSEIIARKVFFTLVRGYYINEYIILNDLNFVARIYATNDQAAIEKFELYCKGGVSS